MFEEKFKSAMDNIQPSDEAINAALATCHNNKHKFAYKSIVRIGIVCCLVISLTVMIFIIAFNSSSETIQGDHYFQSENAIDNSEDVLGISGGNGNSSSNGEPTGDGNHISEDISQNASNDDPIEEDNSFNIEDLPIESPSEEGNGDTSDVTQSPENGNHSEPSEEPDLPNSKPEPPEDIPNVEPEEPKSELPNDNPNESDKPSVEPEAPNEDEPNMVKLYVGKVSSYAFAAVDDYGNMYEVNYSSAEIKLSQFDIVYVSYKSIEQVYDRYMLATNDELWGYDENGDNDDDSDGDSKRIMVITAIEINVEGSLIRKGSI